MSFKELVGLDNFLKAETRIPYNSTPHHLAIMAFFLPFGPIFPAFAPAFHGYIAVNLRMEESQRKKSLTPHNQISEFTTEKSTST
jgi:hypothetical protein